MTETAPAGPAPSYSVHVFSALDMAVVAGANLGDPLMPLAALCPGDIYHFLPDAGALELKIRDAGAAGPGGGRFLQPGGGLTVASGSEAGLPGDRLTTEGRLTFIAQEGDRVELLLIALGCDEDPARMRFFLPLAPFRPKADYTLIGAVRDPGEVRLADIAPVAFTRGTAITLADGRQRMVEDLRPGDRVLTRDSGPQPLRWIGRRTVRAIGPFAPVVIASGTFANDGDLVVSQYQRLFIYQAGHDRLAGTAELLVRARDLVDGEHVFIRRGGFVEYFHLVFDAHEIIYAACMPTESLLIDERTLGRLSDDLAREVATRLPRLAHRPVFATEAGKALLAGAGPAALRRSARRG